MQKLYINKVVSLLGGLRGESELDIIKSCFGKLTPEQAAQVVINNR